MGALEEWPRETHGTGVKCVPPEPSALDKLAPRNKQANTKLSSPPIPERFPFCSAQKVLFFVCLFF